MSEIHSGADKTVPLLVAEDLTKSFHDGLEKLHVLKGVNLKIERGEMVAITGPSGAGKSTLLHLLGTLDRPTDGKVYLEGADIYGLPDAKLAPVRNKRIGFVFQFYHLLPEFSVFENVLLPAMAGGKGKTARERASRLLDRIGLGKRMHHLPGQLSGGEMQRTAIARALINNPDIVFADEPTGNLDSDNSTSILNLMKELNEEDRQTFVIATHDCSIAGQAKRVLSLTDGRLVDN
jgi:lipoprotein-releasing system ATP-binding protein